MDPATFDRIIEESIAEEIASRDFYAQASRRIADSGVKEIFESLSKDEEQHRLTLERFRFDPLARVEFAKVADFGVAEAEVNRPFSFDMTPKDAFSLAMKKEQKAMEIYQEFAARCSDPEIRGLYTELAEMERGHKARLEDLFTNVAYPEQW